MGDYSQLTMGAIIPLYRPEKRSSLTIVDKALAVDEYLDAVFGSWNRTLTVMKEG